MSFNRSQRRSETLRRGSPDSHEQSVRFVARFIARHWKDIFGFSPGDEPPQIHVPLREIFSDAFLQDNENKGLQYRIHEYDIGVVIGDKPVLVVEVGDVGDDSKHQLPHKKQLINDGIAEKWMRQEYGGGEGFRFYRINKDDALDQHHLAKVLWRPG